MSRSRLDLDGTWHFYLDPKQRLSQEALAGETLRAIQVPGPWQAQFDDLRDYSGVAWYRRVFEVLGARDQVLVSPANTQYPTPNTYVLHFGAVDYHATV